MKDYLISKLKLGNYFSKEAFLDENYILLSPEIPFDADLRSRLFRWEYTDVYSDGHIVNSPADGNRELGGVVNLNLQVEEQTQLAKAAKYFNTLLQFTSGLFEKFTTTDRLYFADMNEHVKPLVDAVKNLRPYMLRYDEFESSSNFILMHSVKTAILGIILGNELRLPLHKLIEIGIACLIHEIGMLKLPPQLYMTDKLLNAKEKKALTAHPMIAFKILKANNFPLNICTAVFESNENVNGSGYPQRISGARISQYGKIVAISSSYAAIISNRPFRVALDRHHAMVEMLKLRNTRYDTIILNALLKALSIYPIGTFVQVKTGSEGIVTETFPDKPRTPIVRLLKGPQGEPFRKNPIVDTSEEEYQIVAVLPLNKAGDLRAILKG